VASERHFFDLVKETLQSMSKPGHDAWAEFLKFLNLYSNDVLNRKDMLNMLEDVFGKHKVRSHTPHQPSISWRVFFVCLWGCSACLTLQLKADTC
jgi:hypothetical protein